MTTMTKPSIDDELIRVKNRLKQHLDDQGISMAEVGRRLGITRSAVANAFSEGHIPQARTLDEMARTVGMRVRITLEDIHHD